MIYNISIRYKYICLLCFLVLLGCKKDGAENCRPLPEAPQMWGWQSHLSTHPQGGCFNPSNPNEIVYYETVPFGTQKLIVYNLQTEEKKILHTANIFMDNPQWSTSGWILFNTAFDATTGSYTIYKVRPDGSEKEILVEQSAFSPVFDPTGTKFIFQSGESASNSKIIVMDLDANILKQCPILNTNIRPVGWYSETKVLMNDGNVHLATYDLNTCALTNIITKEPGPEAINGIFMHPNTLVWYSSERGLYKTDITTGETFPIKSSCNSVQYIPTSYSPQLNRLAIQRMTLTTPDSLNLYEKHELVLMKPDGTCEKVIDLGL